MIRSQRATSFSDECVLIRLAIGTMMLLSIASLDSALATDNLLDLPSSSGLYDLSYTTTSGTSMRYSILVPEHVPLDGSQPLTLVLHYGGPPSGYYGRPLIEQLVQPALSALHSVMVAPVTLGGDWSSAANEAAVYELLSAIEQVYKTDPAKRLITGYSMGGAGAWYMISRSPEYFSAAIPVSGFAPVKLAACKPPVYALHSTTDSIFDAAQLRQMVDSLDAGGCNAKVAFVEGVDHFNIPAFGGLLELTVPWVKAIWGMD